MRMKQNSSWGDPSASRETALYLMGLKFAVFKIVFRD